MKIILTEPTTKDNTKSVGCWFIENTLQRAGYNVEYQFFEDGIDFESADLYLFSVLSVRDYFHIQKIAHKKKDKIWIAGGHVTNNPYILLHWFDLICVGEGEEWILKAMRAFEVKEGKKEPFLKLMSGIEGSLTLENRHKPIRKLYIEDISINGAYLNKSYSNGHGDSWYIETARGCKSKCGYCELGWTTPYRESSEERVNELIQVVKESDNHNVKVFAPDDFSVTPYERYIEKIVEEGLNTKFGSMRLDRVMKVDKKHRKNFLYRLGIDGLSGRIRDIVGKRIFDKDIIRIITIMAEEGFVNFKFFFIFSYSFENEYDFYQFEKLIHDLRQSLSHLKRPIFLRLKFTPFVPQELTPMENFAPHYNQDMKKRIDKWFLSQKKSNRLSGNLVIIDDGVMEQKNYYAQAYLHRASYEDVQPQMLNNENQFALIHAPRLLALPKRENLVYTHSDKSVRDKFYKKMLNKIETGNNEELTDFHSQLKQSLGNEIQDNL